MQAPYTKLYAHLVWATWDRAPMLGEVEAEIGRIIGAKTRELGCQALAIGGDLDHIHVLARLSTTISVATLVGEIKGASSHWMNFVWRPSYTFRWQGSYGAFSVSPNAVPKSKITSAARKNIMRRASCGLSGSSAFCPISSVERLVLEAGESQQRARRLKPRLPNQACLRRLHLLV